MGTVREFGEARQGSTAPQETWTQGGSWGYGDILGQRGCPGPRVGAQKSWDGRTLGTAALERRALPGRWEPGNIPTSLHQPGPAALARRLHQWWWPGHSWGPWQGCQKSQESPAGILQPGGILEAFCFQPTPEGPSALPQFPHLGITPWLDKEGGADGSQERTAHAGGAVPTGHGHHVTSIPRHRQQPLHSTKRTAP